MAMPRFARKSKRRGNNYAEVDASTIDWLLDIALDHLTLARVGLIRAILTSPLPQPTLDLPHVAAAVNGLRNAGTDGPPSHKACSPPRCITSSAANTTCARARLDEAQQIAERGPMPLYLADVHLHRARMFRDQERTRQGRQAHPRPRLRPPLRRTRRRRRRRQGLVTTDRQLAARAVWRSYLGDILVSQPR